MYLVSSADKESRRFAFAMSFGSRENDKADLMVDASLETPEVHELQARKRTGKLRLHRKGAKAGRKKAKKRLSTLARLVTSQKWLRSWTRSTAFGSSSYLPLLSI